jgi:hypothetical protein
MTELEKQLLNCLMELYVQVDEDCPHEYRTKHLHDAIEEARCLIDEMVTKMKRMPT